MSAWLVERLRGGAGELHQRSMPEPVRRSVWIFEVDRPALVLGSTQDPSAVDRRRAAADGVEIVRRRSGGGVVLMVPGEMVWVDVVIPVADRLWQRDVGVAFHWLGEAWRAAVGSAWPGAEVHRGPLERQRWSDLVCFAGLGPGEVTVGGAKAIGLSQRRTRDGARFQGALHRRWRPDALAGLLSPAVGDPERLAGDLGGAVAVWPDSAPDPATALVATLEDLMP